MNLSDDNKAAFNLLKTVCTSIIKQPSTEHPEQLCKVLNHVGNDTIERFSEYILFPIKLHIFNEDPPKRDDTICILLDCLYQLLNHLKIKSEALFMDVYSIICFSLVKKNAGTDGNKATSEELKISALKSVEQLFSNADQQLLQILYGKKEFYSKLCVLVYNSLQFASKEKNIKLRVEALKCLIVMCQLNTVTTERSDVNLDLAKIVKKCLPGLITECRTIVSEGHTQNHQITVLALRVWSRSVSLVMADCLSIKNDNPFKNLVGKHSAKSNLNDVITNSTLDNDVLRNEELSAEWVKVASKRLSNATDVFTMLKLHPHHKVRRELVSSVTLILTHAPINMNPSLGSLLDSLIVLTEDSNESVAEASRQALNVFKSNWSKKRGRLLVEDVKDCLYSLLKRLPRILHGTDDNLKESDLILLCGYIQLLGHDHFAEFISSQQLLDKLIICLQEAAVLDVSRISLLEDSSLRDIEDQSEGVAVPWRNFSICHSGKLQSQLKRIFYLLGAMPNLSDIALSLLDHFHDSPLKRLELTLIINDVVLSSQQLMDKQYLNIIKSLLNEYLEPYFWDSNDSKKMSEEKSSIVQACLCIEGIGKLATSIGAENFSPFLFKSLYPLLEYAGSPYYCLSQAGVQSVQSIAKVFGVDVGRLVENNVDYLSHHISIKLKNVQRNVTVLYVLSAVMKHSNMDTLPSLMEIINNVLIQSCDKFQINNFGSYLLVFQTFVTCLHSWLPKKEIKCPKKKEKKGLIEILLELKKNQEIVDNFMEKKEEHLDEESTEIPEELEMEDDYDEKKVPIPDYIKLTEAIVTRSAHFLPSKVVSQQILVMQIIDKGALILQDYQDVLLPVVHKIWSPLVERFEPSNDPLIIKNAFNLLCTLAFTSKDFIRQRSLKTVLPKICTILEKLSVESKLKPQLHNYRFSQKYKLQVDLIQGLGDLAINIDIAGKDIYDLLNFCHPYLSSTQPQPLQEACIELFTKLCELNRYMVWLHLMSIWPQNELLNPKADFQRKYQIPVPPENSHYSKNVIRLLNSATFSCEESSCKLLV